MSRETILARIRSALPAAAGRKDERPRAVAQRLANPPHHPRPAFASLTGEARHARLIAALETQGTDVIEVASLGDVPAAVATLLGRSQPTPPRLVIGDDARLAGLSWEKTSLTARPEQWDASAPLEDGDAALTHAWGAVAETGTLVLLSGAASPASLTFLPEFHLVALARESIVSSFEEAFRRIAESRVDQRFPRAVNLVSGPSRTGDIGGRIVKGAHGPRRLGVILYG